MHVLVGDLVARESPGQEKSHPKNYDGGAHHSEDDKCRGPCGLRQGTGVAVPAAGKDAFKGVAAKDEHDCGNGDPATDQW